MFNLFYLLKSLYNIYIYYKEYMQKGFAMWLQITLYWVRILNIPDEKKGV